MDRVGSDVLVVGSGVSGLTTALCLAEAGFRVRIWTEAEPRHSTSCSAGAIYGIYQAAHERAVIWSEVTLAAFQQLAERDDTGVALVNGTEVSREVAEPPAWATEVPDFQRCEPTDLPAGYKSGWTYTVPLIDMPRYLDYLTGRLRDQGVPIEIHRLKSLDQAVSRCPIIVNCTGMGARDLVPDPDLYPVRGQLVVMPNPGLDTFFAEHSEDVTDLTYVLPQGDHVVLGGSAHPGEYARHSDPQVAAGIVERCLALEPRLVGLPILEYRVGLRPYRDRIRVEHQPTGPGGPHVLHNYGHGGAGVSLSWGCARDLVDMIKKI
jgi:D-amino-acid oxidase